MPRYLLPSMHLAFDLLTPKPIEIIYIPWVVCMSDMVNLSEKDNILRSENYILHFHSPVYLTF
jgi:hypothetical protein